MGFNLLDISFVLPSKIDNIGASAFENCENIGMKFSWMEEILSTGDKEWKHTIKFN